MRNFFDRPLDTAIPWCRIDRRDGVTIGLAAHDRDLVIAGLHCRATPGFRPSAVAVSGAIEGEAGELAGVLDHAAISAADLEAGRWDGAAIAIGIADWTDPDDHAVIWRGRIGAVERQGGAFAAEAVPGRAVLCRPAAPRTSPTCRATFCDAECGLSGARFAAEAQVASVVAGLPLLAGIDADRFSGGRLRWIDGTNAGLSHDIAGADAAGMQLDPPPPAPPAPGDRAELLQGCDKTFATCTGRFGNAVNFRGEPHVPGNDLLTRLPRR